MTPTFTRRTALATGAAALALPRVAAAQQMAPRSDRPVSITFYNYNLASAGIGADATREMMDTFMRASPNVKVEGIGVASDQILSRLQADVVAGRIPDVAQLVFADLDFIVKNLGVKPLEDIVPRDEWAEHTGGMVPAGLRLGALEGKTYGLAYTFSTPILFYNATIFRAAGLDPDSPPRTWEAVKAAALAIRERAGKNGVYPAIYSAFDWLYQSILLSNGGRMLSEDRRRLTFAEPPSVEAVRVMRDLVDSGAHPRLNPNEGVDAFMSGNLGMMLNTSVYQRALINAFKDKYDLRAAPMPAFGDKPTRPTNSGSALFVLSRDPAKQRAAWELIKHMTSREGYTIITSKIGYLPLRLDIVDDPRYLGPWVAENQLVRPNLEQLTRLERWESMPGPNYRQISKLSVGALNDAVFGGGDVAAILKEAQDRAQALMPRGA